MRYFVVMVLMVGLHSCQKAVDTPTSGPTWQQVDVADWPLLIDHGNADHLLLAIDRQLAWFGEKDRDWQLTVGTRSLTADDLVTTLLQFRAIWEEHHRDPKQLSAALQASFELYAWYWNGSADILITGYHAPIYAGSREPDTRYRYPLYGPPKDRVHILPRRFHERMLQPGATLRGDHVVGRVNEAGEVVPYFTRQEIDQTGALAGRDLELVYLDDYFNQFLFHVQGGGFVQLPDGRYMKLNYAGKNGQPYTSIGRVLVDEGVIPEAEISIQAIEDYFAAHPEQILATCFRNASYVFYATDGETHADLHPDLFPHGVLGFPVTSGRSIATDKKYLPGGTLFFVVGEQRRRGETGQTFSAFALDQDTGGAIRENHIDFFQGAGPAAEERAGLLKDHSGRIYLLVHKE